MLMKKIDHQKSITFSHALLVRFSSQINNTVTIPFHRKHINRKKYEATYPVT